MEGDSEQQQGLIDDAGFETVGAQDPPPPSRQRSPQRSPRSPSFSDEGFVDHESDEDFEVGSSKRNKKKRREEQPNEGEQQFGPACWRAAHQAYCHAFSCSVSDPTGTASQGRSQVIAEGHCCRSMCAAFIASIRGAITVVFQVLGPGGLPLSGACKVLLTQCHVPHKAPALLAASHTRIGFVCCSAGARPRSDNETTQKLRSAAATGIHDPGHGSDEDSCLQDEQSDGEGGQQQQQLLSSHCRAGWPPDFVTTK